MPNHRKSFLKEGTFSISNIEEKHVNMSSEEILPVTAESNYKVQVTDICDGNAQEGVLQITIAEPVMCYQIKLVMIITREQCSLLMLLAKAN